MAKETEACGRCSMTVVVDAVDGDPEDPFDGDSIEVEESTLRRASPEAWFSGLSSRINDAVSAFAWRR